MNFKFQQTSITKFVDWTFHGVTLLYFKNMFTQDSIAVQASQITYT